MICVGRNASPGMGSKAVRQILQCGSARRRASLRRRFGHPAGGAGGRACILNARRGAPRCSANALIFTAAVWICNFRIMKMKLHRAKAQPGSPLFITGCITAMCTSAMKKCQNRSATFAQSATRSPDSMLRPCVFFIVRAHYRSPLHYSPAHLEDAHRALTCLYTALKESPPDAEALDWQEPHAQRFRDAMNDDFNTPEAVAVLFDLAGAVNRSRNALLARQLKGLAGTLGLLTRSPHAFLRGDQSGGAELNIHMINARIEARRLAKRAKNYIEADRIRAELLEQGVILEDRPDGSTEWRRAPSARQHTE